MSHVCVSAPDVINFIKEFGISRESYHGAASNSPITLAAKKLRQFAADSKIEEQKVLDKFQVGTLEELQNKIDGIVADFSGFQSAIIRKSMKDFAEKYDATVTDEELNDALIEALTTEQGANTILGQIIDSQNEEITDKTIEELTNTFKGIVEIQRQNKGSVKTSYLRAQVKDFVRYIKNRKQAAHFSRAYKKDLLAYVKLEGTSTWNIRAELEKNTSKDSFNFYPYFNLSLEEQNEAQNDINTWNVFVQKVSSLVDHKYSSFIEDAMSYFSIKDFFQYDINGIIGIFGEVQALAILMYLLPQDRNTYFRAAGNIPNELKDNQKLGADILLDDIYGIQVKNYQGYSTGYRLQKDFTAHEVINRLTSPQKQDLGSYLAIISYNRPLIQKSLLEDAIYSNIEYYDQKALAEYTKYYHMLTKKEASVHSTMKTIILSDIKAFWTFEEMFKASMAGTDSKLEGTYHNVFWFFGGKKLIASSQIFNLLAKRVEQLGEQLQSKSKAVLNNFFTTYHDKNLLRWYPVGYDESGEILYGKTDIDADKILDNISISMSLNLYLKDIQDFGDFN